MARGNVCNQLEKVFSQLFNRGFSADDTTGVEIKIFVHFFKHETVTGQLDDRSKGKAGRVPAPK